MFINFVFKYSQDLSSLGRYSQSKLLNIFYTEKVLIEILKPFNFKFKNYNTLSDDMICFVFYNEQELYPPTKILNCIPKNLGIVKYGYEINNTIVKVIPSDIYKQISWDYKHGECKVNID